MPSLRSMIRIDEWKASKINPLFAGGCLAALQSWQGLTSGAYLVVFMAVVFLNASFGYAVNNLSDRRVDEIAGKPNPFIQMKYGTSLLVVIGTLILGLAIATLGFWGKWDAIALTAVSFALAAAYSLKPIRFKERGVVGLVVSALAQRVVPLLIVMQVFNSWTVASIAFAMLAFVIGIRFMVIHQMDDLDNDIRSGVATFSTSRGLAYSHRFLMYVVGPLELTMLSTVIIALGFSHPVVASALGVASLLYVALQVRRHGRVTAFIEVFTSYLGFNPVYAIAFPVILCGALVIEQPLSWPLGLLAAILVFADVMRSAQAFRRIARARADLGRSGFFRSSRHPQKFELPIGIALFNRPEYARQVLESLRDQSMMFDEQRLTIHLDGYAGSRDEARDVEDRTREVEAIAREIFPSAEFLVSSRNSGIARAHASLEERVFAHDDAQWALICEEDFVLHPAYLAAIAKLIQRCNRTSDVVMVSATGDSRVDLGDEAESRPLIPLLHLWAYAIRRTHVDERKVMISRYLDSLSSASYWQRDDATVWHACASVGLFPMGSSQDYVKRAAMRKLGRIALTTRIPYGFYVGELGEHFNPQAYRAMGYDRRPDIMPGAPDVSGNLAQFVEKAIEEFDVMMAEEGARNIIDPLVQTRAVTHTPQRWHVEDDQAILEGPFPDIGLYRPFVWLTGNDATIVLDVNQAGRYTVRMLAANNHDEQVVSLSSGENSARAEMPVCGQHNPFTVELECELKKGSNELRVGYSQSVIGHGDSRSLGLMLLDVYI